ncbi:MAG: outer membrane protein assembly factor BamA [Chlorobi bacterium]|nr:outer membrane protein assembly factor BamA [Chlorobiota bacterium]
MVKPVNKSVSIFRNFLIWIALLWTGWIQAQESRIYVVNDIIFEGLSYYNPQTVRAGLGIKKGDIIRIPGNKTAEIVKKLWNTREFEDVQLYYQILDDDKVNLIIVVREVPRLSKLEIKGIPRGRAKTFIKELKADKGRFHVNSVFLNRVERTIKDYYVNKGYLKVKVRPEIKKDSAGKAEVTVYVDKGPRVRIDRITFEGNESVKAGKLRRKMKKTKRVNPLRFWKNSKFIRDNYEEDKKLVEEFYRSKGFRNAYIISDSVYWVSPDRLAIDIKLQEGRKYYFRNIDFVGNTVYSDEMLAKILGIKKGDVYNGKLLNERIANPQKPDAVNLTNLYQNNGYLFSRITPVEVAVEGDSIDFEIRIYEGKVAYFNNITVSGNDRTKDYVILREVRTLPGAKYSRDLVVRTVRELAQLGYFNPENILPEFRNVDPVNGLVDINWKVEEGGASQIQLQAGYGGPGRFLGTLALSLNNFALSDILKKKAWNPIPMGEGQRLTISANFSFLYRSYRFGFTEPWLGGKKPQALSVDFYQSKNYLPKADSYYERDPDKYFMITGVSTGLGKRLKWPDDYFQLYQSLSYQRYRLQNYAVYSVGSIFGFDTGVTNNLTYNLIISRPSSGPNPIFPTEKSDFTLSMKFTPPYSLFDKRDFDQLKYYPEYQDEDGNPDYAKINQEKFRWLEYYKIKFSGTWYNRIYDKLVLRTKTEFGMMGRYSKKREIPPFERFYVGGDMPMGFMMDSRDMIPLRGYSYEALNREALSGQVKGGILYNKFSLELRYPLTLKPQASIYVLAFAEGANTYSDARQYNPFALKRSAGVGIRIFMQMFGLLGIDFGYGFDPVYDEFGRPYIPRWRTSFILNQQL